MPLRNKLELKFVSLEAAQLKNMINRLKNSLEKDHKEFIKNNKLILKTQQRFRSEKHNASC